jgi:hypothetical protein
MSLETFMKTTLMLRPFGRSGNGAALSDHDHVYQYDVLGLPLGHSASIAEMEGLSLGNSSNEKRHSRLVDG